MKNISFAKTNNFDTQKGFSTEAEPAEKTKEFSSILSNIFVELQMPPMRVKPLPADEFKGKYQAGFAENMTASAKVDPKLSKIESIPTSINDRIKELYGKLELQPSTSEISQTNSIKLGSTTPFIKPMMGGNDSEPNDFESESDAPNIVLKPIYLDKKLIGFDLKPNDVHSILGTFDQFLNQSDTNIKVVEPAIKSAVDEFSQTLNVSENDQPKAELKTSDSDFNAAFKFDRFMENVSKDRKFGQIVQNNQSDPVKIIEQINPHLLELAVLTDKTNDKQILRMRLHPAELGTVEIKLERNNAGTLNAYFKTETDGAHQALSNNLEQLRDSLQNAGWQIGQMEITSGSFSSTANQNRENTPRQPESVANNNFSRSSEQPDDLEQNSSNRLLSLLA